MSIIDFCEIPRTMAEVIDAGFSRDQVYNNVKNGRLVNITRRDAWGRTIYNRPGLFQAAESHDGGFEGHNWAGSERSAQRYDARPLVGAWGGMS